MRPPRWRVRLVGAWVALTVLSNVVRLVRGADAPPRAGQSVAMLDAVNTLHGDVSVDPDTPVALAYRDWPGEPGAPTVLLVHGSPGDGAALRSLGDALPPQMRVVSVDLPGFGSSTMRVPDYSSRAHAVYLEQLLDELGENDVHLAVHSLGGAVGIELAHRAPERVASLTLMAAVGVQELELLGRADANHALHAAQLWGLRALTWGAPHFGLLDRFPLNVNYARNFADTSQAPLRGMLERLDAPLLVLHGVHDMQVPVSAAREHHRLVPQSEAVIWEDSSHFFPFLMPERTAGVLADFVRRAEDGRARTRATGDPERVAAAAVPFDPKALGPPSSAVQTGLGVLLGLGSLVTEDLSCVAAGLLVADGRLSYGVAVVAIFLGIFLGDVGLMLIGRVLGRAALSRPPLSRWISPVGLDRASAWVTRHGPTLLLTSRFMPGMRLPVYVASGTLKTPFLPFCAWLALGSLLWAPAFVGVVAVLGEPALRWVSASRFAVPLTLAGVAAFVLTLRQVVPLATWRGRRLAVGRWRRLTRWEFWPTWAVYWPVVFTALWHARKTGLLTAFTATNPGIEAGGSVGESKWDSFVRLGLGDPTRIGDRFLPRTLLLEPEGTVPARLAQLEAFVEQHGLDWPVVLKPDVGQRGDGVAVARSRREASDYLRRATGRVLAQEYIPGEELGLYYVREPGQPRGRLFSVTHKLPLDVVGDGESTLETLILADERAVCLAEAHLDRLATRLDEVPPAGQRVRIQELGTHSRGSVFMNGRHLVNDRVQATVDAIAQSFEGGFHFGRLDVRVPDLASLETGGGFFILEVNGVSAEATHIYHPGTPLREGRRVLHEQMRLAYAVGAANAAQGAPVTRLRDLLRAWRRYQSTTRREHGA